MSKNRTAHFSFNGKTLNVFCVALNDDSVPESVLDQAQDAFKVLSPFINDDQQVLYIRDIPFLAIKGKYPGGHCYNSHEAMISVVSWKDDPDQIKATINHELHHMARWQNPGYGDTLGGAILSEGLATCYEKVRSGWLSPWANAKVTDKALEAAIAAWDDANYNHGEWFFSGPHGEWVGYGIGYKLAEELFKNGFDLARSIRITPKEAKEHLKALL